MLLGGIGVFLFIVAVVLGIASVRRRVVGLVGLGVFGALGVAAALTRPTASIIDALPSIVGAGAGALTLVGLHARLPDGDGSADAEPSVPIGVERRRFLMGGLAAVGAALAAGGLGQLLSRRFAADESRAAVSIPKRRRRGRTGARRVPTSASTASVPSSRRTPTSTVWTPR